jgi:hypothetical protein
VPALFEKEFLANLRNVSINMRREIALAAFKRIWRIQQILV